MTPTKHLKGLCTHCRLPLEFPAQSIGLTSQCPHCGRPTELLLAPPPADASTSRRIIVWTAAGVLAVALGVGAPLIGLKLLQKKLAERGTNQPAAPIPSDAPTNSNSPGHTP
ncbi:MAG: hypothetical protein ACLQVX_12765 [Limisphaerales bacterium]